MLEDKGDSVRYKVGKREFQKAAEEDSINTYYKV